MAMQRRIKVQHSDVYGAGVALKGSIEPVIDFEKSTKDNKVQAVDLNARGEGTGLLMWQGTFVDFDEEASKKDTVVTVKFAAKVRPVPPENKSGFPWTPVEFVGLTALPYVDDNGNRPRLAWSFRAEGMVAPGGAGAGRASSKDAA
ncbi:plasmid replication, integration and excision activator [Luteipulveratus sp. YIM 133132]|uniref:plasmid replication, integration and excision activator n=1 Tax=Luteipulveratus flavus TaxID=3031728 RepID=UPI0023B0FEF6|nr:plasmid replication, integration and excision activator [Luteipulveratus sp. YIM 133132]MDE9367316.1 plasmid replication, integration and excision activator [Luteipulveratus sp. YIM 133132]